MKKFICLLLLSFIFCGLRAANTSSTETENPTVMAKEIQQPSLRQPADISAISINELEQLSGKKLSIKEKMGWWLYKKQLKKQDNSEGIPDKKQNDKATLGFVFSLLGLLIFPLFAIVGFIYSNNALKAEKEVPGTLTKAGKRNAKAGKIISIVAGILWVAIIALVVLLGIAWNK